jgi:DNA helicase TIP49 (TBP-interacting protein)
MEKESATLISATRDVVKGYLSPASIQTQLEHIKVVGSDIIDVDKAMAELRKKSKLTKEEEEKAKSLYRSAETELLPRGDTRWRLANALSLLAQGATPDRSLELEEVAGEVAQLKAAA